MVASAHADGRSSILPEQQADFTWALLLALAILILAILVYFLSRNKKLRKKLGI